MTTASDRTNLIEAFFSKTGPTYETVVHLFTLGIDRIWKKKILLSIPYPPKRALDLACGTGLLTFEIARTYADCKITGVDISESYLDVARKKSVQCPRVRLIHQRAEDFLSDERFDVITASYLPKYADLDRLFRHIALLLAPGGAVILHDFTYPTHPLLQKLFEGYMTLVAFLGGGLFPEWKPVLQQLPHVIRKTRWMEDSLEAIARHGFCEVQVTSLTLQGSAMIVARKPLA